MTRTQKSSTIKDVARTAGVSVTTVSNMLNGRTDAMSSETLQRIQSAIRELDYHPSRVARSMVTRRTATIGVVLAEIETPLFLQALEVIEPLARNAGHSILLTVARNLADEQNAIDLFLEKQVDGVVFLSTSRYVADDDPLSTLPLSVPPIVLVNRTTSEARFNRIDPDNTGGVIEAVDYLVRLGHTHIAHLHGPESRRSYEERLQGYKLGLAKNGLPYRENYVLPGDYTADESFWMQSTLTLLAQIPRPTAFIASNDIVAAVVMRVIQQVGLNVPGDVSVIGIDDQPFCRYLNPTLTTVQLPILDAGRRAIEMLLALISGEHTAVEHLLLPCPLVVRQSSGPVKTI